MFDIKMDSKFTRKARFVAGGHMTKPPSSMTLSTSITRESVRIAFLLAGLNKLDKKAGDISNAYLNAPCRELICIVTGPEFGSDEGCDMKVVRAWYGLKSSGAICHAMLSQTMMDMKYTRCKADHDVWYCPAVKPNGFEYYEYVLIFVEDILNILQDTNSTMETLGTLYQLNCGSVGPPDRYLGRNVQKFQLEDGTMAWFMSTNGYVKTACTNVVTMLEKDELKLEQGDKPKDHTMKIIGPRLT